MGQGRDTAGSNDGDCRFARMGGRNERNRLHPGSAGHNRQGDEVERTMLYVHIAAAFGASNESELARKLFSLNSDGIEELKPVTLDFSRGIICADSYKVGASNGAGLKVVNPANPHK